MCSGRSDTPSRVPGFPIRISTDQSLVGSSPWLFAATHVLHRCQVPRHPPLALCSLEEQRCSYSLCSSQGASSNRLERAGRESRRRGRRHELNSCRRRLVDDERSLPQSRREDSHPNRIALPGGTSPRPTMVTGTDRASSNRESPPPSWKQ